MRQQNVEHLGQIRTALLESDGALSLLFFEKKDIKWGLPIFPKAYQKLHFLKKILLLLHEMRRNQNVDQDRSELSTLSP